MATARRKEVVDVNHLAAVCNDIGEAAGEPAGFVSVHSLMTRFRARLIMRPLLVEAMIATIASPADVNRNTWAIIVDSERYKVNDEAIRTESSLRPLPARFRNTVAHELVHSLVFRPSEFGLQLAAPPRPDAARRRYVAAIESATERLSPLLLLPERTLRSCLAGKDKPLTAAELRQLCSTFGISRYVLINRLMLTRQRAAGSELREHPALKNLGVGMGEWTDKGEAVLKKWPLFINFSQSIAPAPLIKLANQDVLPAREIVNDRRFLLCGGSDNFCEFTCEAGLPGSTSFDQMKVRLTVEAGKQRPGAEFLFALSRA